MANIFYAGSVSQTIDIFVPDSSSAVGAGLAGLVFNTASLAAYYRKGATGAATVISLATQTVGGAWATGGFVKIDDVNMKGEYRFDIPNLLLDTEGITHVMFFGAANMAPVKLRLDCRPVPANIKQVNDNITAALNLAKSAAGMITGTVGSGSTISSIVTSAYSIPGVILDQTKSRVLIFNPDTTTPALRGQGTTLLSTSNATNPVLTVTDLTTAPVSGDKFFVV